MSVSHTADVALSEPSDQIDLEAWLFGLSDADYQACAKGHQRRLADAGTTTLNNHTTTTRRPVLSKRSVSENGSFAPIKKEQSDGGHRKEKS
jgi:hypothetical protein